MYDVIFYILSLVVISSAFYISFGKGGVKPVFSLLIFIIAVSGIYVLLNSELFAFFNMILCSGTMAAVLILFPRIKSFAEADIPLPKVHYLSIGVLGILTALIASIASSTRWAVPGADYSVNTFMLIFSRYLPAVLLTAVLVSVLLISAGDILTRKNNSIK